MCLNAHCCLKIMCADLRFRSLIGLVINVSKARDNNSKMR